MPTPGDERHLKCTTCILRHRERFFFHHLSFSSINFQTHESYVGSHSHGTYFLELMGSMVSSYQAALAGFHIQMTKYLTKVSVVSSSVICAFSLYHQFTAMLSDLHFLFAFALLEYRYLRVDSYTTIAMFCQAQGHLPRILSL